MAMKCSNTIQNLCGRKSMIAFLSFALLLGISSKLSGNFHPLIINKEETIDLTPIHQPASCQNKTFQSIGGGMNQTSSSSAKPEKNRLIIKTNTGSEKVIILERSRISVELPFASFRVELKVETTPDVVSVSMNYLSKRTMVYVVGIGSNSLSIGLVYQGKSGKQSKNSPKRYQIALKRQNRVTSYTDKINDEECYLEQDCGLMLYSDRKCGLQRMQLWSMSKDVPGYWKMRCNNCSLEQTCLWSKAEWIETDNTAILPPLPDTDSLRTCLKDHQVLFLGDSTLREMMHTLTEKVNTTLSHAEVTHGLRTDNNVGMATNFTFSYYKNRWVKHPPTFREALDDLVNHCPTGGKESKTILAVGGVQWLTSSQITEVHNFITKKGIPPNYVYIKLFGSGFVVAPGSGAASLNEDSVKKKMEQNDELRKQAREYGFGVVNTFHMTLSRYREFHLGVCACHFHEVTQYQLNGSPQPIASKVHFIFNKPSRSGTAYHIDGDIHLRYTDILIRQMCNNHTLS